MFRISLITLGDPGKLTGGYLYQNRMAIAAPRFGSHLSYTSFPEYPFPFPMLAAKTTLAKALRDLPDVLLVDSIVAAYMLPVLLNRQNPVPICGLLHQPPGGMDHGPLRSRLQAILDLSLYRRCSLLIATGQIVAAELKELGIPSARLRVVPPGLDRTESTLDLALSKSQRDGANISFLCVANWLPRKGIHSLIKAFALLPPEAGELHLVGDNSVDPKYTHQIIKTLTHFDMKKRVHVHGSLPPAEVTALYRAADVFVLPSLVEPYGMVYGEAMAFGLPIVGVKAGNLPNLITPGVEGLLAAPSDIQGLATVLRRLANDGQLRETMGDAARRRAASFPSWDESASAFFSALREAI